MSSKIINILIAWAMESDRNTWEISNHPMSRSVWIALTVARGNGKQAYSVSKFVSCEEIRLGQLDVLEFAAHRTIEELGRVGVETQKGELWIKCPISQR